MNTQNLPRPRRTGLAALLSSALVVAVLPAAALAQTTFIDETFDADALGAAPVDPALRRVGSVTVVNAPGGGRAGHFNDASTSAGGSLEYNVGATPLRSLQISFDLHNQAPDASGSAANPIIFGVGNWNDASTSVLLGANANRAFGVEFYQSGSSATVRVRVGSSVVQSGTYPMSASTPVFIVVNDHDSRSLDYDPPGSATLATLSPNSAAVFVNGALVGGTTAGFAMSTVAGSGDTTGDNTIGRIGFNSSTSTTATFLIDNLVARSVHAVPALSGGVPPSSNFDLTKWNITLPVDGSGGFTGTPLTIDTPTLSAGYTCAPYLYTSSVDGAMVFKCPYNGATGGTSPHPRSELRETYANGNGHNWLPSGTHRLRATCYLSSGDIGAGGMLAIGQIHGKTPNTPSIILRYDNTVGDGKLWVSVKHYADNDPSTQQEFYFTPVGPGTKTIAYELEMVGDTATQSVTARLTANGETFTRVMTISDAAWWTSTQYFKAGAYYVGPVAGQTAKVSFTELAITHE